MKSIDETLKCSNCGDIVFTRTSSNGQHICANCGHAE